MAPIIDVPVTFRIESLKMIEGCVQATIRAAETGAAFDISPQLRGRFQLQNAMNAVAAAFFLFFAGSKISKENIEQGIATAVWPGRIEKVRSNPDIYLDGAHNPAAARELAAFFEENLRGRKLIVMFGALRDKAVDEIAGILFPLASEVIFTQPNTSRSISASQLAEIAGHHVAHYKIIADAEKALESAMAEATPNDVICVTGSLYLVGQLRRHWQSSVRTSVL